MSTVDIIVPSYRGMGGSFQKSLAFMRDQCHCKCGDHDAWECNRGKHSIFLQPPIQSCIIHWVRNALVSEFVHAPTMPGRPPAEYCLLLDDDILMESGSLERLLSHRKDIVIGICTKRSDPPEPTIYRWDEKIGYVGIAEWKWDSQKLFNVDAAGAACMLVKRKVFEDLATAYLRCVFERQKTIEQLKIWDAPARIFEEATKYWNEKSELRKKQYETALQNGDWQGASCWWFELSREVYANELKEGGEDLSFCHKVRKLGYKIFADPQVKPGHIGEYAFSVHDYVWAREAQKASSLPRGEEHDVPAIN